MRPLGPILLSILLLAMPAAAQAAPVRDSLPVGLDADETLAWGAANIFDIFQQCTSSVLRLSEANAKAIEKDGIAALDAMGDRPADGSEWRYAPWIATPVDIESRQSWSQNGYIWGGLACGLNADWQAKSQHIGTKPGAFYTFGRGVLLLVDPAQRLVVYTQKDSLH
jgi:hypothetical protein